MVILAISTMSYWYVNYMKDYINKTSLEQLESLGSITEDKVDLYIQQMQDKIELFNTRKYLYNQLIAYNKTKSPEVKSIIDGILAFAYSKEEDIIDIVILDAKAKIISSKRKEVLESNAFLKSIRHSPQTQRKIELVFLEEKTTPLLYMSSPVLKKGKRIGMTVFVIKLTYLNKILSNYKALGKTGEIFMGAKNGSKLILFTPLKFSAYPLHCTNKDFNHYISTQNTLADTNHKTIKHALDYTKESVVLSLHYNKALKSVIVVKKEKKELMQPIDEIKRYQIMLLLISIVFIIVASLLISNSMIKVIKKIVRITSDISNGKLEHRIEISTKDELGTLGISVNKMADFMLNANAISEAKAIEKTKLLQQSNSELKRISLELEKTVLELQQHNANLSTIIKSLSHDIKTPLTIINGYLEEIDDGLIECKELPRITAILKKETAYLNELSSEVIGYIQSKELTSNQKEHVRLKEFLEQEVYPLLRVNNNVVLKCDIGNEFKILFNTTSLKKIMVNLLHNASKYTQNGFITTTITKDTIVIQDTGIGIDPKYAKVVFEPFFAIDESRNREKNGFGLGLSIASNLAKTNGYILELDTNYSNGCRFVLKKNN